MDRSAEFPLQSGEFWPAERSCKRNSPGKLFGCLVAFCLLATLMLALPVIYLLARHLREPQACNTEERAVRVPEFQKQTGTPPATELKPRIHLEVSNSQMLIRVPGQFPTLQWKQPSNSKVNMKYENASGSLVIPKSGDYYVYAQVTFRNQFARKQEDGMKMSEVTHVTQIISKRTSGYPVPIELLRSSRSINEKQNWNHALYLGAIARLQENDKLLVNISRIDLVDKKGSVTFFGAYLI